MCPIATAEAEADTHVLTWQEFSRTWRDPAGRRQLGRTGFPVLLGPDGLFRWINMQAGLRAALQDLPELAQAVCAVDRLRRDGQIRIVDHLLDGSEAAGAVQSLLVQMARHRERNPQSVAAAYVWLVQDTKDLGMAEAAFLDALWQVVRELPEGALTPDRFAWLLDGDRLSVSGVQQVLNLVGGWSDVRASYAAVAFRYLQGDAPNPRQMVELLDWLTAHHLFANAADLRHLYRLHASADVRGSAAAALIASGQPTNIEYVQRFFPYDTESVRYAIIEACTTWSDPAMPSWIARRIRAVEDLAEFQELMKFAHRHPGPLMLGSLLTVAGDAGQIPDVRVVADLSIGLAMYLEDDPAPVRAALEHLLQRDSAVTANLVRNDADVRSAIQRMASGDPTSSLGALASQLLRDNPTPEKPLP